MPAFADRVKETTTTTGTGTLTLDGAATGFQSFTTAFGNGVSVYYVIAGGSEWEIGIGTTGAGTLSRDTVLQSSNADALVSFSAGTKDVFCAYVADRAVTTVDAATLTNKTISGASNTLSNIGNAALTNSSVTVNGTAISLGSSGTVTAAAATLTGSTLASNVVSSSLTSLGTIASGVWQGTPVTDTYLATISTAGKVSNSATTATENNTASAIVARDASGNFTAGTITAALSGNATTATTATQVANALTAGTYLTSGGTFTGAAARTFAVDATNASTASKVVARDANGSASFKNVKLDGTTSGTVTVQPAAAAGTWSLTLPTTAGSSGQVLSTDGSGVTSWATVGGQTVVNTTSSYNLSAADAGKLIVYTGTSTANTFFTGASLASGLSTGQSIDIANNSQYQISVGGAQVFDSTYASVPWGNVNATVTAIYPNGKILVATNTTLQRFNADGTADNTFTTITPGSTIYSIAISSDGSAVFVAGGFTQVTQNGNTVQRNYVVKLNGTTGIIDTSFVPFSGLNSTVTSVAVSGTTVAVSFSGGYRQIAFMNSTTGADLGGYWTGQYGGTDCFGFQGQPLLKQHPTTANTFIAFASSGYYYIDYEGNYTYFNAPVFHVTSGGGQSYTASNGTSIPSYTSGDAVLITSTHIYWAAYTGYFATVYRLTIGTYSSGLVSNNWNAVNSTPVSVFSRTTDGSIFVGTTALITNGAASSVFNFPANLASVTALPIVTTITSGGSGIGVLGQSLSNGSLLLCNVVVANTNTRIAKTVLTFESAATIAYPPYQNGQFQATGFTATTEQPFRTYQTMRLQKMSNGQLLVTQRNTPFQ